MLTATLKPKTCAHCAREFMPARPMQQVCGGTCARRYATNLAKAKAAAEKEDLARRKDAVKTFTQLENKACKIAQEIARLRDHADGCISCHMGANYGGQWHGSHYRSRAAASAVQLNLWNIHKACAQCNLFKGGNREFYRPRLIEKIGLARVEWLDCQNGIIKQTPAYREYLCRYIKVMGKRRNRMRALLRAIGATK